MSIDWKAVFIPATPLAEIILRGTLVYLLLFVILRVLRREAGALSISDLLVVVLIADAAQNAMGSQYRSVTEGAVLVATIVAWDYLLEWLGYRFSWANRLLRPAPLPLIKEGRLLRRNLRQEMITAEELRGMLREHGVERIEDVKKCYLEADGHVSVIQKNKNQRGDQNDGRTKRGT